MGVVAAAKSTYELARLGAESLRTKDAFKNISGGAYEAEQNLQTMRAATRGAVSDVDAMAAANRLMQMGLADNATELEAVTTMAVRLGGAMGRDAKGAMEDFALLLANQSIPRLDTFGISGAKVRERIIELQEATEGMSREQAFMIATMEEGEAAMLRLGDATDDPLLAFEELEANWKNLTTTAGEMLAPAVSEVVGVLADAAEAAQDAAESQRDLSQSSVIVGHGYMSAEEAAKGYNRILGTNFLIIGDLIKATAQQTKAYQEFRRASEPAEDAVEDLTDALEDEKAALEEAKRAMSDLSTVMKGDVSRANDDFLDEQADIKRQIGETKDEIDLLDRQFANGLISLNEYADDSADLRGTLGDLETAYAENASAHDEATARILFNMAEQKLAMDGLEMEEVAALEQMAAAWGLIDTPTLEALTRTAELTEAFENQEITAGELVGGMTELKDYLTSSAVPSTEDMEEATANLSDEMRQGLIDDSLPAAKQEFEEFLGAADEASEGLNTGLVGDSLPATQEQLEETTEAAEDTTEAIEEIPEEWETRVDIVGHLQVIAAAENVKQSLEGIPTHVQVTVSASVDPILRPGSPSPLETSLRGITDAVRELAQVSEGFDELGRAFGGLGGTALDFLEDRALDPLEDEIEALQEIQELRREDLAMLDKQIAATRERAMAEAMAGLEPGERIPRDALASHAELNELLRTRAINAGVLATQEGQLNELLEEQAQLREAALAFEEAKENLEYLEQQKELIDTIAEYGLDQQAILQGLQLGVGADPAAMMDAMTRALEAVIWQTQADMARGGYPTPMPAPLVPTQTPQQLNPEYHLHIHTSAPVEPIIEDFEMMVSTTSPGR